MPAWMRICMIVSFLIISPKTLAQEICAVTPEGRAAALQMIAEIQAAQQMQNGTPIPWIKETPPLFKRGSVIDGLLQYTPWGDPIPFTFSQYGQRGESVQPKDIERDLIPDASKCLGQYGCLHDELHPYYQFAFRKLGCYCHTGQCRPSTARRVALSDTNETGYQVLANGRWCDVPKEALRRDRQLIPATLLQFRAHVCVSATSCEQLECAIIDDGM